jgi:DNA-binding response OmpR family regulator
VRDLVLDPKTFVARIKREVVPLRTKEFQLLYELASHNGKVSSREDLAEAVWGYEHLPSSRTIDVHIRKVRALIAKHSDYTYIQTVYGVGYRFSAVKKEDVK